MVITPWGESTELRRGKLGPGRQSPGETTRDQRERLFGGLVACCADRGFRATTVADIVSHSGVSRRDFYRHFSDKRDCAVAAVAAILEQSLSQAEQAFDDEGCALRSLIDYSVQQPAAARLCLVEAPAIGPLALKRLDAALSASAELYGHAQSARTGEEMPEALSAAVVGGLRKVISRRLQGGAEGELADLAEPLWEWAVSYSPPPRPLPRPRPRLGEPGTYLPDDPVERILAATVKVVATEGYESATVGKIVAEAGVSLTTLYEEFNGKDGALLAALRSGWARLAAAALPPFRRAPDWPAAVLAAIRAALAFLAVEPEFARVAIVEICGAGESVLEERETAFAAAQTLLEPGFEHAQQVPKVAPDAISGAIYEIVYEHIRRYGPRTLPQLAPLATYIALAPFLGAEQACEVARGRR